MAILCRIDLQNGRREEFAGNQNISCSDFTIAVGDRIEWREAGKRRRIPNHAFATITGLDGSQIQVKFDKGGKLAIPIADARKLDLRLLFHLARRQGATVDRVIMNVDSHRGPELVNQRQQYVGVSRAKLEAHVFTDSIEGMRRAVQRKLEKSLALDVMQKQPSVRRSPRYEDLGAKLSLVRKSSNANKSLHGQT